MAKLYALESDSKGSSNDLLIDRVMEYSRKTKPGIALTAQLIKDRQSLKEEINKEMQKEPEDDADNRKEEPSADSGADDRSDSPNTPDKGDESPKEPQEKSQPSSSEIPSDGDAADDEKSLDGLIGSGLKDSKEESKKPAEEKKEKEATESYREKKVRLNNVFDPLRKTHQRHRVALEAFSLESEAPSVNKQPVVYVKDAVVEALNNLIQVANTYIAKNLATIESAKEATLRISERVTVYETFHKNGKFHFTNKLVQDKDVLSLIGMPGKSSLRESSTVLVKYLNMSNQLVGKILENPLEQLTSAFGTSDFEQQNDEFSYRTILPGFELIRASVAPYTNYIETKYSEFQVFKVRTFKTEDLYTLNAIGLTDDKDAEHLFGQMSKILIALGLTVDNLTVVTDQYKKFIDDIKAITYDVEKEQTKNLSELGLDEKLKDFIKFKLVTEIYVINADSVLGYLTTVMSVLDQTVELSE